MVSRYKHWPPARKGRRAWGYHRGFHGRCERRHGEGCRQLGSTIEGVGALAALGFDVFGDEVDLLAFRKPGDSGSLRLDAQAGFVLLPCGDTVEQQCASYKLHTGNGWRAYRPRMMGLVLRERDGNNRAMASSPGEASKALALPLHASFRPESPRA